MILLSLLQVIKLRRQSPFKLCNGQLLHQKLMFYGDMKMSEELLLVKMEKKKNKSIRREASPGVRASFRALFIYHNWPVVNVNW